MGTSTASAGGYGCAGSEIDTYPVTSGSTTYGVIHLYYDSSDGTNCAVNVATSAGGYGADKYMSVSLILCSQTSPSSTCAILDAVVDAKTYKYYAGPVPVGARGHCIQVRGRITYNGHEASGGSTGATHCG
ncbi:MULTISPECIES: hypothetical protein [unclassified Kitasatospora]|uniref:hypothetical protein n=1 Tax=unclassified Kitasatospora TaxID=2633591 RepID=UPI0012F9F259|nr:MULTISPECIES: hypothetical protein [unclassified Kitasatospora]